MEESSARSLLRLTDRAGDQSVCTPAGEPGVPRTEAEAVRRIVVPCRWRGMRRQGMTSGPGLGRSRSDARLNNRQNLTTDTSPVTSQLLECCTIRLVCFR